MPHVPRPGHTRRTHGRVARKSHDHSGYLPPLTGAEELVEQTVIDGVVGEQNIMPGAVGGGAIRDQSLETRMFIDSIRPVEIVDTLPTLPDPTYPDGSLVVLTSDHKIYRNNADVWVNDVDGADLLADSVSAGAISAGAIATEHLAAGEITIFDESGEVFLEPEGFGETWSRFLRWGFRNGDFVALPPTPGSDIDNSTNPLPGWSFVKSSGTAITARSIAATANGSQRALRFSMAAGAANDKSYIEQIFPIVATKNRAWMFTPYYHAESTDGDVDGEAIIELQFLKKDLTTTGSNTIASMPTSTIVSAGGTEHTPNNGPPPADAYYARVRFGLRRRSGGSNAATANVVFNEVLMLPGMPRTHIPEVSDPATYGRATIMQISGNLALLPDANYNGTDARSINFGIFAQLNAGSFEFPTNPDHDGHFYRTDLGLWFVRDNINARWLSDNVFEMDAQQSSFISATTDAVFRWPVPSIDGLDLWIEDFQINLFSGSGGSTLSASHKWEVRLETETAAGATALVHNTVFDSGAASTWLRNTDHTVDAAVADTILQLRVDIVKTGTPSNCVVIPRIRYRLIAT